MATPENTTKLTKTELKELANYLYDRYESRKVLLTEVKNDKIVSEIREKKARNGNKPKSNCSM